MTPFAFRSRRALAALLLLTAAVACSRRPERRAGEATSPTLKVGTGTLSVEVADDEAERARGLMFRDTLPPDYGMLFVFPDERVRSFWMANTRVPLSIAFLNGDWVIVDVRDMTPMDTSLTTSARPARYAVEANRGWFAEHGAGVGDTVRW